MSISSEDLKTVLAAIASRGVKSLSIGDRRIDYLSPDDIQKLVDVKNSLETESEGGLFHVRFTRE
jgi:hypothetical protein